MVFASKDKTSADKTNTCNNLSYYSSRITLYYSMTNKKVELLAPAGNFACFRAAINAGADAVYLGGEKFGARAYADNFSPEEIIDALITADRAAQLQSENA